MDGGPELGGLTGLFQAQWKSSRETAPLLPPRPCIPFISWISAPARFNSRLGRDPACPVPVPLLPRPPSPGVFKQWLKRWEDPLDNQAIALSGRMNAVGLVERGRACHTIEKKRDQCQTILFR